MTLEAGHRGHDGLEVVAESHGEATDDQAGVVEKQPPRLAHHLRQRSQAEPGQGVADTNKSHQVASLSISQAELLSVVLNITIKEII